MDFHALRQQVGGAAVLPQGELGQGRLEGDGQAVGEGAFGLLEGLRQGSGAAGGGLSGAVVRDARARGGSERFVFVGGL